MTTVATTMRAEQFRAIFAQGRMTLVTSIAVAAVVFFVLLDKTDFRWLILWASFFAIVTTGRLVLHAAYYRVQPGNETLEIWLRAYMVGAALGGLAWGGTGLLLAVTPSLVLQGFIIIAIGGVTVGAISSHAVLIPAYLAFVLPATLPLALWQISIGESVNIGFGALVLLFLAVLVFTARYFHRNFVTAFIMQNENMALAEKAHTANRAKSDFLTGVSHELRTPLNAIIGYNELIKEELTEKGVASSNADLDRVNQAARHLLGLIDHLLDLSKVEAGKLEMVPEEIKVSELISDVAMTSKPLIDHNGNRLVIDMNEDPGIMFIDKMRLKQCLLNLVGNAAKFTQNGTISISVTRSNGEIAFSIIDTGIGISKDHLIRLFDEFSQAESTTARDYGGTGLGLSITQKLVQLMGGDVEVESESGKGSRFTLNLPVVPPDL